jgi:hypothetical protein
MSKGLAGLRPSLGPQEQIKLIVRRIYVSLLRQNDICFARNISLEGRYAW